MTNWRASSLLKFPISPRVSFMLKYSMFCHSFSLIITECRTTPRCVLHPSLPSIWIRHETEMVCSFLLINTWFHLSCKAYLEFPLQEKKGVGWRKKGEFRFWNALRYHVNQSYLTKAFHCGWDNCAVAQGLNPSASTVCSALNTFFFLRLQDELFGKTDFS